MKKVDQKSSSKINFKNQLQKSIFWTRNFKNLVQMNRGYVYLKFCTLSCKTGIRCPPTNPTSTYKSGQVLNLIAVYNDLPKRFLSARKMHPSCNGRYWHISPVHAEKKFLLAGKLFKVNYQCVCNEHISVSNTPKMLKNWSTTCDFIVRAWHFEAEINGWKLHIVVF